MHKEINDISDKKHARNKNNQKRTSQIRFNLGDYVLWSTVDKELQAEKLQLVWRDPYRIVESKSEFVFEIEHLVTKKTHVIHASRLKFYRDDSLIVTQKLLDYVTSQCEMIEIEGIKDFCWNRELKHHELEVG